MLEGLEDVFVGFVQGHIRRVFIPTEVSDCAFKVREASLTSRLVLRAFALVRPLGHHFAIKIRIAVFVDVTVRVHFLAFAAVCIFVTEH